MGADTRVLKSKQSRSTTSPMSVGKSKTFGASSVPLPKLLENAGVPMCPIALSSRRCMSRKSGGLSSNHRPVDEQRLANLESLFGCQAIASGMIRAPMREVVITTKEQEF